MGLVKDNEPVMLQCIGAGAVNQYHQRFTAKRGFILAAITCPTFDIEIAGEEPQLKLPLAVHTVCPDIDSSC